MRTALSRQRGISFIGVILLLAAVGFVVMTVVKLGPSYMTFLTVRSVMEDVREDPSAFADRQGRGIINSLMRRLNINEVRSLNKKDFKMKREADGMKLSVDYEVREHLIGNVDVILVFKHDVMIPVSDL